MFYAEKHTFGPVTGLEVGIAPFGSPIKSVYLYHLGTLLIDTGPHHLRRKVTDMVAPLPVTSILLTHHHEDHSGNAARLSKELQAPVSLHPYGAAKLADGFRILPYQHILFGRSQPLAAQHYPEIIETDRFKLTPLHTPGHSKDHTVFHLEEQGWLFSGDLYVGEKIQFFRVDEKIEQQIDSLKKISTLDFKELFCAHRPSIKDGPAHLRRKLDYLESFHQQVHELHRQGLEEKEIVRRLRIKSDLPVRLFTMGNASFANMVHSSLNTKDR
ncbi:MAG: MBL fold metallo-hydrolase [Desulfobulbaceae bacterium]|nr:MAG: MBL fold metallo-hydrolase [Desulfobulbaceae bacterium]